MQKYTMLLLTLVASCSGRDLLFHVLLNTDCGGDPITTWDDGSDALYGTAGITNNYYSKWECAGRNECDGFVQIKVNGVKESSYWRKGPLKPYYRKDYKCMLKVGHCSILDNSKIYECTEIATHANVGSGLACQTKCRDNAACTGWTMKSDDSCVLCSNYSPNVAYRADFLAGGRCEVDEGAPGGYCRYQDADPECTLGVLGDTVCCDPGCGTCGGTGCSSRPGGAAKCCRSTILGNAASCDTNVAPCVVSGATKCNGGSNQCLEQVGVCQDSNAICSDNEGEFSCQCKYGFTGSGIECEDVDECAINHDDCAPDATCTNTFGGNDCTCNDGYSGSGYSCRADCEREEGTSCNTPTAHGGECTLSCGFGYTGGDIVRTCDDGFWTGAECQDIDECALNDDDCAPDATCDNTIGGYTCTCNGGYAGNGFSCEVVPCTVDTECAALGGDYFCLSTGTCASYGGDMGDHCNQNNLCGFGDGDCDAHADCQAGLYCGYDNCKALHGNFWSSTQSDCCVECVDNSHCGAGDHCASNGKCVPVIPCNEDADCVASGGNYFCLSFGGCASYTSLMAQYCHSGNLCGFGDGDCDAHADCQAGLYCGTDNCKALHGDFWSGADATDCCVECLETSHCEAGHYCGPVGACVPDEDECADNSHGCSSGATCVNTVGSYTCACNAGYSGDGITCTDNDECAAEPDRCHDDATCYNTPGSYACVCNTGFTGDGVATCGDEDECVAGTSVCSAHARCTNTVGSHTCECSYGFTGDGLVCDDVDECLIQNDDCKMNQANCTNTFGGYDCTCHEGFTGDGFNCHDIDECADGTDTCGPHTACVNVPGAFLCPCVDGYTESPDGLLCVDKDECSSNSRGVLEHNCGEYAECTNTDGSFTCACPAGFTGDGYTCEDIDECADGIVVCGDPLQECINTAGSAVCTCVAGYSMEAGACVDDDECALATDLCDIKSSCSNTVGSYTCGPCEDGYTGDGYTCNDVDECFLGQHPTCQDNAHCVNYPGTSVCSCDDGFEADGDACIDVDECAGGTHDCDGLAICSNTIGSFDCTCVDGYEGAGNAGLCTDTDECASKCTSNGVCTNSVGSFECICDSGYEFDGSSCQDVDECILGSFSCFSAKTCVNTIGSYACECADGWDGEFCDDVDECADRSDNCHNDAECVNTLGGFVCECDPAFVGHGVGSYGCTPVPFGAPGGWCRGSAPLCDVGPCVDDFCVDTCGGCPANEVCDGDGACLCKRGFVRVGGACVDDNECDAFACGDTHARCDNTEGSFTCTCNAGYQGNGFVCEDRDECATDFADCAPEASCTNTDGWYECECNAGYTGSGFSCSDVDECALDTHECHPIALCYNTVGSYTCDCDNIGYTTVGKDCIDIDECAIDEADCAPDAICTNTVGWYLCGCPEGYVGNGWRCDDIDECLGDHGCHPSSVCSNNPGGFVCACAVGMRYDPELGCQDIDECLEVSACHPDATCVDDSCHHTASCLNTFGSFTCTCPAGYEGPDCHDIDECEDGSNNCHVNADCTNIEASFTCACSIGFEGTGLVCDDIDECYLEVDGCHASSTCTNTPGSFYCACITGFEYKAEGCTEINECDDFTHDCWVTATCENTVGSYTCTCDPGWEGDGTLCDDVDECATGSHDCGGTSTCANTLGSFECTCPPGYSYTSWTCQNINECADNVCSEHAECNDLAGSYECSCPDCPCEAMRTAITATDMLDRAIAEVTPYCDIIDSFGFLAEVSPGAAILVDICTAVNTLDSITVDTGDNVVASGNGCELLPVDNPDLLVLAASFPAGGGDSCIALDLCHVTFALGNTEGVSFGVIILGVEVEFTLTTVGFSDQGDLGVTTYLDLWDGDTTQQRNMAGHFFIGGGVALTFPGDDEAKMEVSLGCGDGKFIVNMDPNSNGMLDPKTLDDIDFGFLVEGTCSPSIALKDVKLPLTSNTLEEVDLGLDQIFSTSAAAYVLHDDNGFMTMLAVGQEMSLPDLFDMPVLKELKPILKIIGFNGLNAKVGVYARAFVSDSGFGIQFEWSGGFRLDVADEDVAQDQSVSAEFSVQGTFDSTQLKVCYAIDGSRGCATPCLFDSHCDSNDYCYFGQCKPRHGLNHFCVSDRWCQSRTCHGVARICVECNSHGDCRDDQYCLAASGECHADKSLGRECIEGRECQSGHCSLLHCVQCTSNSHCDSDEQCVFERCKEKYGKSHTCLSDSECKSGKCRSGGGKCIPGVWCCKK